MEEEDVVDIKVLDGKRGDVLFQGKVSTNVTPAELLYLGCFWERGFAAINIKATNELVKSFKGLQRSELVATAAGGRRKFFARVLYAGVDGVLRNNKGVPSCDCMMMSVGVLSFEECEKAFQSEKLKMLEELEVHRCGLKQIPSNIGKIKKLKKLRLHGLLELKSITEEIGGTTD